VCGGPLFLDATKYQIGLSFNSTALDRIEELARTMAMRHSALDGGGNTTEVPSFNDGKYEELLDAIRQTVQDQTPLNLRNVCALFFRV
jgi:hypothetical protein